MFRSRHLSMPLGTLLLVCVVFVAVVWASQKATIDGVEFEVSAYGGGTLRLRMRSRSVYEVQDVVVGEEVLTSVQASCNASHCTFDHGAGRIQVSRIHEGTGVGPKRFHATYSHSGVPVTEAVLYVDDNQPKADFTFPAAQRLYGIPERAVDLALKSSTSYRMMNLDVFKYRVDEPSGVYGTIPYVLAHGGGRGMSSAILFLNSADCTVSLSLRASRKAGWNAEWRCESGMHDIFFFAAPTPSQVHALHAKVVGTTQLPPLFGLGYHQSRWNYRTIADCLDVDAGFDEHNIPYDALWLDIEHTDGKRYFTWDPYNFAKPQDLTSALAAKGRKLVTIVDPHVKRDDQYYVHREARDQGFYVKTSAGADYEGDCWPGQSSWVDYYNADARAWYAGLFSYERYQGSAPNVHIWIDMNEPTVFKGHEMTMDKTAVHHAANGKAVAHRDLHNMYGYYHAMTVYDGLVRRNPPEARTRPFMLTRSFFSGSQRFTAVWTGDNVADWNHLQKTIPMLLALSVANFPFAGSDVGGFFGHPSTELLVRWYQVGVFSPFFRGHAHLESKRREPWLFGDDVTTLIRDAIVLRYALLPYLYTLFATSHGDGSAVLRPMFYEWPHDDAWLDEQRVFMFGPALLVRPVVEEAAKSITVPLPPTDRWFAFPSLRAVPFGSTADVVAGVTLSTLPMYLRGGHIWPLRERLRRNAVTAAADPVTLYVVLNDHGKASGTLYLDDAESFKYQRGAYALTTFSFDDHVLRAAPLDAAWAKRDLSFQSMVTVDKIVIVGLHAIPTHATVTLGDGEVDSPQPSLVGRERFVDVLRGSAAECILRRPQLLVDSTFTLKLHFAEP